MRWRRDSSVTEECQSLEMVLLVTQVGWLMALRAVLTPASDWLFEDTDAVLEMALLSVVVAALGVLLSLLMLLLLPPLMLLLPLLLMLLLVPLLLLLLLLLSSLTRRVRMVWNWLLALTLGVALEVLDVMSLTDELVIRRLFC